mmetsp:Transcript_3537/g.5888  ORF Transcript_3537/g.5888 Transcript_3537/m.5888 type:complete len:300 (+) Transcript_3537:75-974(+)
MESPKRRSFASAWLELKANDGEANLHDLDADQQVEERVVPSIERATPATSSTAKAPSDEAPHAEARPKAKEGGGASSRRDMDDDPQVEDSVLEHKAKRQCRERPAEQPTVQTKMAAFFVAPMASNHKVQSSVPPRRSPFALHPEGSFKDVPGFEAVGLQVARVNKKLPKTQSWCFVPLIYSALQQVPQHLRTDGISSSEQIADAQQVWHQLFSHWQTWCKELAQAIDKYGQQRFEERFLPKGIASAKSWTTSLVYGEPRVYGRLPHPHGRNQDAVLSLLHCDTQNQIFASVMTIATQSA